MAKRNISDFELMEPMKYYDNPAPKTTTLQRKREDIIENVKGDYIATVKNDGDWSMCIHICKGNNLIRSRSISKVTGKYGDYTDKLPHLVEEMDNNWPDNSVVLAEICWGENGTNANTVGTILRCLPKKAVERQKEKKLKGLIFDVLMWNGEDLCDLPYEKRLDFIKNPAHEYFIPTEIVTSDFAERADEIIAAGGEGLVLQKKENKYYPGTRTAWITLKLKQALPHMELKVVGTLEPNKEYQGTESETWQFKEDGVLVTKPYFYKWKNGITVLLPSGITTDVASGLTDDDREYLATPEAAAAIANGELWATIKAMSINDLGRLRHPALVRLRTDRVEE